MLGRRFGLLTVEAAGTKDVSGRKHWLCSCDCGGLKNAEQYALNHGMIKSCGCLVTKHGQKRSKSVTPEYRTWQNMHSRCSNPKLREYVNYGGRGISVCSEWGNFEVFFSEMGTRPSKRHTLDRKDNNKGYSKENCRWATAAEQQNNRRNNLCYDWDGEYLTASQIYAKITPAVGRTTVKSRLDKGWSIKPAMQTPLWGKKA